MREYTSSLQDYFSSDSFRYEVCDDTGLCDEANVTITILDQPPQAVDDSATTTLDTPVDIDVLVNDSDPESNIDPSSLQVKAGEEPVNGTAQLIDDGNGNFYFTYTPTSSGTTQNDVFTYIICDTTNLCDEGIVTINITNRPPQAVDDNVSTKLEQSIDINVLANDSDPDDNLDNSTLKIVTGEEPVNGTAQLIDDGNGNFYFTYTPFTTNFNNVIGGIDTFTYEICDLGNPILCDQALVTITFQDQPPTAQDDTASTDMNTPVDRRTG